MQIMQLVYIDRHSLYEYCIKKVRTLQNPGFFIFFFFQSGLPSTLISDENTLQTGGIWKRWLCDLLDWIKNK